MKEGIIVVTHKDADFAVRNLRDNLNQQTMDALLIDDALTCTLFAKTEKGKPFGNELYTNLGLESSKLAYHKLLITEVPQELRKMIDCGFAINLSPENFNIEFNGDKTVITLTLAPKTGELIVLENVLHESGIGHASDSTLWIPTKNKTDGSEERYIYTSADSYSHLIARSNWDLYRNHGINALCNGSSVFKVLVYGSPDEDKNSFKDEPVNH